MSTCIKYMLLVAFVISLGISLNVITSYRYLFIATRNYDSNDLSRGVSASVDPCQELRDFFWNAPIRENMSFSSCIKRYDTRDGIFACFVNENFVGATCPKKVVRLAETDMPQVALASFPGSGNTWSRHLIEYVSGLATGSIYCGLLVQDTFIGECEKDTSKTIVIKTHLPFKNRQPMVSKYKKAILILRNPFDALVAHFNRRNANLTAVAPRELFQSKSWEEFITERVPEWRKHAISWITEYKGPLHIVFYENMVSNFYEEMYRLFTFLGLSRALDKRRI